MSPVVCCCFVSKAMELLGKGHRLYLMHGETLNRFFGSSIMCGPVPRVHSSSPQLSLGITANILSVLP